MVNNSNYKLYATQIAGLYCKGASLCKASMITRLLNWLDNDTFAYLLSNLTVGRLYYCTFENIRRTGVTQWKMKFVYNDVITGKRGSDDWTINDQTTPEAAINSGVLRFVHGNIVKTIGLTGTNTVAAIVHNPNVQSYGITFVPTTVTNGETENNYTTNGGSTGSSGSGSTSAGTIVKTPSNTTTQNASLIPSGFDMESLVIPGLLILGFVLFQRSQNG